MRRRTWIKRVRTLSLAMLIASVGLWGVSEFLEVGASIHNFVIGIDDGAANLMYFAWEHRNTDGSSVWADSKALDGVEFRRLSYHSLDIDRRTSQFISTLTIPFWLTSGLAFGAWLPCAIVLRRSKCFPGMCPNCGYDASRCTEGRCSECGQPLPAPTQVDAPA